MSGMLGATPAERRDFAKKTGKKTEKFLKKNIGGELVGKGVCKGVGKTVEVGTRVTSEIGNGVKKLDNVVKKGLKAIW